MALRTANPVLNANVFRDAREMGGSATMTVEGAIHKTAFLLVLLVVAASYTWTRLTDGSEAIGMLLLGGSIGGLILGLVTCFKADWSPVTAPIYAICEGLVLGAISAMLEQSYHGIAIKAVAATFGVLFVMLIAYRTGLVSASDRFRAGVVAATGGICLMYLVSFVAGLFGAHMTFMYDASPLGIGINLLVAAVAALNLVLDFDLVERGAASGAPKYMEWYAAFGLLVTLVWLYMEIIRLLARLQSRDR